MKRYWLIQIRKQKGLTQKELALKVGLTRQMISAIEQGIGTKPSTAQKIAAVLGFDWTRFYEPEKKVVATK